MTAFIVFRLIALRRIYYSIYENYYINVFLLLSASLSVSDDFVLVDSLDGNGALFANVLCAIPGLRKG